MLRGEREHLPCGPATCPPTLPGHDELYAGGDDDWMSRGNAVIVDPTRHRHGRPAARPGRHPLCRGRSGSAPRRADAVRSCRPLLAARRVPPGRRRTAGRLPGRAPARRQYSPGTGSRLNRPAAAGGHRAHPSRSGDDPGPELGGLYRQNRRRAGWSAATADRSWPAGRARAAGARRRRRRPAARPGSSTAARGLVGRPRPRTCAVRPSSRLDAKAPGSATAVTRISPTAAAAVTRPKVMATPLLSAMEPMIMPAIPPTNTAMTSQRMVRGDTAASRGTSGLYLMRWGWSASAPSSLWRNGLVLGEVALEPAHDRVALEGEHVGRDAVEEPAIVADDHGAAGELLEAVLEGAQRVDVEVVGGLVEQQHVAALLEHLGQVDAVALAAREHADLLLLVAALEVERRRRRRAR